MNEFRLDCEQVCRYFSINMCENICGILKRGNTAVIEERKDKVIVIEQDPQGKKTKHTWGYCKDIFPPRHL